MQLQDPPFRAQSAPSLLIPGHNCWRIERVRRFSVLVDADAYFRAVRSALASAQHSIFILSWDIDSRMRLVPAGANDGLPEPLGEFLHEIVARRKGLHAYILNWDFAMLYALEREWLPVFKLGWRTHRRLAFRLDGRHPIGASHHQKIVVVDDALAFVGGLDLTRCRWDTSVHACSEPLRCDADAKPYLPFHDVQVMLDGNAAMALGELARERWHHATGDRINPPAHDAAAPGSAGDPWPKQVEPDIINIEVAIARTDPGYEGRPPVQEIRQLYLEAIASAQRHLFFENQYFTSGVIADALLARLGETGGPEIVLVLRRMESGWLQELTMGVLRARLHRRLKEADAYGHYRMYCPNIPGLGQDCLNVHSKLMVVDDELLCVGSANLNNRSMVLDTECNVAIEACGDERIGRAIAHVRNRLLAEHLATFPKAVAAELSRRNSLIGAIEALRRSGRSLDVLEPAVSPERDALVPGHTVIDPEQPIHPDKLVAQFVPKEASRLLAGRFAGLGILALALALLAITWRWTPLADWLNLKSLIAIAQGLEDAPFTPAVVMVAYVVAGLCVIPVTLLIAVTGIVFGPLAGALYAIGGVLLSAAVTYLLGARMGRDAVRRLAGTRINRLSRRIARRGIAAMVILRLLPIAPFTVVNVVAGASHIGPRDFLLGTFIGMTPGILVTVTFVHHLAEAIRRPSLAAFAVLAAVSAFLIGIALILQRRLGSSDDAPPGEHQA